MAEEIHVNKLGGYVQISPEVAMEYGIVPPDEAYLAQREANAARYRAHKEEAASKLRVALPLLDAIADPVARLVLDLHQRENLGGRWICGGCDSEGFESEQPAWPCTTTEVVANLFGIDVPDGLYIQRPADGSLDA